MKERGSLFLITRIRRIGITLCVGGERVHETEGEISGEEGRKKHTRLAIEKYVAFRFCQALSSMDISRTMLRSSFLPCIV